MGGVKRCDFSERAHGFQQPLAHLGCGIQNRMAFVLINSSNNEDNAKRIDADAA